MGIGIKFSSHGTPATAGGTIIPGQPQPYRFTILDLHQGPGGVAVKVRYPDATNYEGVKVIVYLGATARRVRHAKILDPHFHDDHAALTPFARFEPTDAGWAAARTLVA